MTAEHQQALDELYALENVLTIKITMPQSDWDRIREQEPAGGRCNFDWTGGARYTWRAATSVEISGTLFPASTTFAEVGVKKKSFCGSIDDQKPCLHLDFGKFRQSNVPLVSQLIGTRYLTLNNSIQDRSYIRQTLGYRLLATAGLPSSRSNYARVFVNGRLIGQGSPTVNSPGIYVSAEPIMKRYIERNFNGNMNGNLYELEHRDDVTRARLDFVAVEDLSQFENKADLAFACDHIAAHQLAGAERMFDLDQFIKIYAMEFFLKHWDGYSSNTNNTYLYNDVQAVENPRESNVTFKLIPWGIDQTLQPRRSFTLARGGLVAKLVRDDPARRAQLLEQIRTYRSTIFGRQAQQTVIKPLIDRMETMLRGFGVPNAAAEIAIVRQQLRLAESAGYLCAGGLSGVPFYVLDERTGECLHISNTETIPPPDPKKFEVYRLPLRDNDDPTDLWVFNNLGVGKSLTNRAFGRALHASDTLVTPQGHKFLYATAPVNDPAEEFLVAPSGSTPADFSFSGYFRLVSLRTNLRATFGEDLTPGGRARIHQDDTGSRLYLY